MVARRTHNPKVVSSNLAPATKFKSLEHLFVRGFFCGWIAGVARSYVGFASVWWLIEDD